MWLTRPCTTCCLFLPHWGPSWPLCCGPARCLLGTGLDVPSPHWELSPRSSFWPECSSTPYFLLCLAASAHPSGCSLNLSSFRGPFLAPQAPGCLLPGLLLCSIEHICRYLFNVCRPLQTACFRRMRAIAGLFTLTSLPPSPVPGMEGINKYLLND